MRKLLKRIGTGLLFLAIALSLAPTLVPPFLDRIYYRGPISGHYDGERFFNPGGAESRGGSPARFVNRILGSDQRAEWPERVAVPPYKPSLTTELCSAGTYDLERSIRCQVVQNSDAMEVTWIGHATALVQVNGLNILTDPIWSERASPFDFVGPKRVRAPGIPFEQLPPIDLVLVSHNHYDHLDLPTLKRLWERDRPLIVTSLGNEAILRDAGIPAQAADWGETVSKARACAASIDPCDPGSIDVTVLRNHHWGSRWGTDRNRALWSAFTVTLPGGNIFFAGDTGWGDGSWVREAAGHGPFRLAILPIGAYAPRDFMRTNHVDPAEAVRMFEILKPARALGMHWGTFQLTFEPIDEPWQRLEALKRQRGIPAASFVATQPGEALQVPPLPSRPGATRTR
jgi:L-ascorbate metabolism protein UlaG (beta-lactamase superfamily)